MKKTLILTTVVLFLLMGLLTSLSLSHRTCPGLSQKERNVSGDEGTKTNSADFSPFHRFFILSQ
jgi:hypothetical protein